MIRKPERRLVCATPFGRFERRTPRAYTHVVVVFGQRPERIRAAHETALVSIQKRIDRYRGIVESGQVPPEYVRSCTLDDYRCYLADEEARLAAAPAELEAALAKAAEIRARRVGSDYRWSQSLARAEAGAREAEWIGLEVVGIFPVFGAQARAAAVV